MTADDILSIDDLPREAVAVPEWQTTLHVRTMTGEERDAFEDEIFAARGEDERANRRNLRARLVARCVVNGDGQRLFSDEQIPALGRKSAKALDRLFAVAQRLNGLSKKDADELSKNSTPAPSASSTSASLGNGAAA